MPRDVGVRLQARQARSVATFERILEAAGALFDEVGVDATTMEAIADRAGVSIGSVYRFFENKNALKATLSARWTARIREVLDPEHADDATVGTAEDVADGTAGDATAGTATGEGLEPGPARPGRREPDPVDADPTADIDVSVDHFITALRRVLGEMPGARGLLATEMREPLGETNAWTDYLQRYIARHAPDLPPERRTIAAHTYQTITSAIILAAVNAGPALDRHLDEVRTVLAGYTRELARESAAVRSHRDGTASGAKA
ncbi:MULTISPECIES: TetR family transcriptional regulator [Pseudofrankia]|uniref:TetR family transcriptional regulator n=1 Tax=Pseudofrankia TaxID=2994363 RepID=UPI000234CFD6|nr:MULTISPECIES: TetR family transcriptional regulator [Pseudofrankia]OHV34167.1 TetR family transcriptional regulator [Pseudofrankia sp. EUN1h]